ncbi:MAG: DnaJ domain-containing protein [Spirochaetes bacterium]|nr:DnaJ domain-containing protein [Spirochaetota bacterium]
MNKDQNEFDDKIKQLDIKKLKKFLLELRGPCFESELLKVIFHNINIMSLDSLTLYQSHFMLFYLLYNLQNEFYKENKYLHIHFMRTFLAEYPDKNKCRFYNEYLGNFCNDKCQNDDIYCNFHLKKMGQSNLENLSSKYFYLDKSNYYKIDKDNAEELINGAWEVLANYEDYKKSFQILDLPETADLSMIKKRYKYLAKKYHPDCINFESPEINLDKKFNEINNAYRYLLKILELKNINL